MVPARSCNNVSSTNCDIIICDATVQALRRHDWHECLSRFAFLVLQLRVSIVRPKISRLIYLPLLACFFHLNDGRVTKEHEIRTELSPQETNRDHRMSYIVCRK